MLGQTKITLKNSFLTQKKILKNRKRENMRSSIQKIEFQKIHPLIKI